MDYPRLSRVGGAFFRDVSVKARGIAVWRVGYLRTPKCCFALKPYSDSRCRSTNMKNPLVRRGPLNVTQLNKLRPFFARATKWHDLLIVS